MNKAFKVLWNDHRRTYVVSSEETASRGKRSKSKTKIAAAVAATALAFGMAGAADARIALPSDGLIDHEWVLQNGSSKLIFANGEKEIIIAGNPKGENGATPVNAKQFIKDLHAAVRSKDLDKIREVLGAGQNAGAVITVTGGGNLVFDSISDGMFNRMPELSDGAIKDVIDLLKNNKTEVSYFSERKGKTLSGDTHLTIGTSDSEPIVLGAMGGDMGFSVAKRFSIFSGYDQFAINRQGKTRLDVVSGNVFGVTGGSIGTSIGGVSANLANLGLPVEADGNLRMTSQGAETNIGGHANAGLVANAGLGLGLGGKVEMQVGEEASTNAVVSHLKITTARQSGGSSLEGIVVGASAGGVSLATMGGTADFTVNGKTQVDVQNASVAFLTGGGIAASVGPDKAFGLLGISADDIEGEHALGDITLTIPAGTFDKAGTSTTVSQDIEFYIGKGGKDESGDASVYGLLGGGSAIALQSKDFSQDAVNQNGALATATTGNITINLQNRHIATGDEKGALITDLRGMYDGLEGMGQSGGRVETVLGWFEKLGSGALRTPGVTFGVMGGGLAVGYQAGLTNIEGGAATHAVAETGKVTLNISGGYNVAVAGGSIALASGPDTALEYPPLASATTNGVEMNVSGGESVGLMGGGFVSFVGTNEPAQTVQAKSEVKGDTKIKVANEGTKVDGLVGGGWSFDDSNSSNTNVLMHSENVSITLGEGTLVSKVSVDALGMHDPSNIEADKPGVRTVAKEILSTFDEAQIAVLGGGIASGVNATDKAGTQVDSVTITHNGTIDGNVYGGGLAQMGGFSSTGTSEITLSAGSVVTGDVYAGGIVRANDIYKYGAYEGGKATVNTASVTIENGATVNRTVHTGGYVSKAQNSGEVSTAVASVENATITLKGNGTFQGLTVVNDGVKLNGTATDAKLSFAGTTADNEILAAFSGFQTLEAQADAVVRFSKFGSQFGSLDKMTLTGGGTFQIENAVTLDRKTLTLAGSTLTAGSLVVEGDGLLEVAGGVLDLQSRPTVLQLTEATNAAVKLASGTIVMGNDQLTGTLSTTLDDTGYADLAFTEQAGKIDFTGAADTSGVVNVHIGGKGQYTMAYADSVTAKLGTDAVFFGTLTSDSGSVIEDLTGNDLEKVDGNVNGGDVTVDVNGDEQSADIYRVEVGGLEPGESADFTDNEAETRSDLTIGKIHFSPEDQTRDVSVAAVNGKKLTIVGDGTSLITTEGSNPLTVEAGSADSSEEGVSTGSVKIGHFDPKRATGGVLQAKALKVYGASDVTVENSTVRVEEFTADSVDSKVVVGTGAAAGKLYAQTANLGGGLVFVSGSGTGSIEHASEYVLANTGDGLNGKYVIGAGNLAVFGDTSSDTAKAVFAEANLAWGQNGVTAMAYLNGPTTLATDGKLIVDGSINTTEAAEAVTDAARFADNSLLIVNTAELGLQRAEQAALDLGGADAVVSENSQLLLSNVTAYKQTDGSYKNHYTIFGNAGTNSGFWTDDNLLATNAMYELSVDEANTGVDVTLQTAESVFGGLMQGHNIANAGMQNGDNLVEELLANSALDKAGAAKNFDAAMSPAGAAGVYTTASEVATSLTETVRRNLAYADEDVHPKRVWAEITGNRTKYNGIATGAQSLDLKIERGGVAFGTDVALTDRFVLGAAAEVGMGTTRNNEVNVKDDFNYYGFQVYGRYDFDSFTLSGNAGLSMVKSDIEKSGLGESKVDPDTTVWTIGVEGSKQFALSDSISLRPYVGADLYYLDADSYETDFGAKSDSADATFVQFPIGAELAMNFKTSDGTKIAPWVNLAVVPTVGDTDIDVDVAYANASDTYNYTFMDDFAVKSAVGIEATKDRMSFGARVGYVYGDEERSSTFVQGRISFLW